MRPIALKLPAACASVLFLGILVLLLFIAVPALAAEPIVLDSISVIGTATQVRVVQSVEVLNAAGPTTCPELKGFACGLATQAAAGCTVAPTAATTTTIASYSAKTIVCAFTITLNAGYKGTNVTLVTLDATATVSTFAKIIEVPTNLRFLEGGNGGQFADAAQAAQYASIKTFVDTRYRDPAVAAYALVHDDVAIPNAPDMNQKAQLDATVANIITTIGAPWPDVFPIDVIAKVDAWLIAGNSTGALAAQAAAQNGPGFWEGVFIASDETDAALDDVVRPDNDGESALRSLAKYLRATSIGDNYVNRALANMIDSQLVPLTVEPNFQRLAEAPLTTAVAATTAAPTTAAATTEAATTVAGSYVPIFDPTGTVNTITTTNVVAPSVCVANPVGLNGVSLSLNTGTAYSQAQQAIVQTGQNGVDLWFAVFNDKTCNKAAGFAQYVIRGLEIVYSAPRTVTSLVWANTATDAALGNSGYKTLQASVAPATRTVTIFFQTPIANVGYFGMTNQPQGTDVMTIKRLRIVTDTFTTAPPTTAPPAMTTWPAGTPAAQILDNYDALQPVGTQCLNNPIGTNIIVSRYAYGGAAVLNGKAVWSDTNQAFATVQYKFAACGQQDAFVNLGPYNQIRVTFTGHVRIQYRRLTDAYGPVDVGNSATQTTLTHTILFLPANDPQLSFINLELRTHTTTIDRVEWVSSAISGYPTVAQTTIQPTTYAGQYVNAFNPGGTVNIIQTANLVSPSICIANPIGASSQSVSLDFGVFYNSGAGQLQLAGNAGQDLFFRVYNGQTCSKTVGFGTYAFRGVEVTYSATAPFQTSLWAHDAVDTSLGGTAFQTLAAAASSTPRVVTIFFPSVFTTVGYFGMTSRLTASENGAAFHNIRLLVDPITTAPPTTAAPTTLPPPTTGPSTLYNVYSYTVADVVTTAGPLGGSCVHQGTNPFSMSLGPTWADEASTGAYRYSNTVAGTQHSLAICVGTTCGATGLGTQYASTQIVYSYVASHNVQLNVIYVDGTGSPVTTNTITVGGSIFPNTLGYFFNTADSVKAEYIQLRFTATVATSFFELRTLQINVNALPPPPTTAAPTTAAPSTAAPTTAAPTTAAPTTAAPTTAAPTTAAPTTAAPTTAAPTTAAPTTAAATTAPPTTAAPTTAAPTTAAPTTAAPTTAAPTTAAPTTAAPTTAAPTTAAPTTAAPTTVAPNATTVAPAAALPVESEAERRERLNTQTNRIVGGVIGGVAAAAVGVGAFVAFTGSSGGGGGGGGGAGNAVMSQASAAAGAIAGTASFVYRAARGSRGAYAAVPSRDGDVELGARPPMQWHARKSD